MGAQQEVMMMNLKKRDQTMLMNELAQGKELAQQLKTHLEAPSSPETRRFLTERILSCYEKLLSLLNFQNVGGGSMDEGETMTFSFLRDSPTSSQDHYSHDVTKKRKASMPRWTEEVRVAPGATVEGPPNDGHNWRKYGQKDILGSKFPRAYYRCTNRHAQGCVATKHVQRFDNDRNVLEVTYRGRHTCVRSSHSPVQSPSRAKDGPRKDEGSSLKPNESQPIVFNFVPECSVKTEKADNRDDAFPCFTFKATPVEPHQIGEPVSIFTHALEDSDFLASIIPGTPEPDYFSMSTVCPASGLTTESDMNGIVSAPASVTNSPITDVIFPFDNADFEPSFLFDDPEFFL